MKSENKGTKAKITWRNIKAVFQAYWRRTKRLAGFDIGEHIWEQIVWRRTQVIKKSPQCWEEGACYMCGCEILGKTMEDRGCSDSMSPCYPGMMSKENWKKYKINNQIKIFN